MFISSQHISVQKGACNFSTANCSYSVFGKGIVHVENPHQEKVNIPQ